MRDYVEWLGLMAVSGGLAVLLNTVWVNGMASAQPAGPGPTPLAMLSTTLRAAETPVP